MKIPVSKPKISIDSNGDLFKYADKYYRAFSAEKTESFVKPLMSCGLVEELVKKDLLAPIHFSEDEIEGYATILEQDDLGPLTYPYEWSFSMLRDCGLAFLELAQTAHKYGYYLKDSHPFNFIFYKGEFLWVDFGSFTKDNEEFTGFLAMGEFLKQYMYPLKLWTKVNDDFVQFLLSGRSFALGDYMKMASPLWSYFPRRLLVSISNCLEMYYNLYGIRYEGIGLRRKGKVAGFVAQILKKFFIPKGDKQFQKWRRKLLKIKAPRSYSQWGDYHDNLSAADNPRFCKIVEILKGLKCASVLELAGNAGELSLLLHKEKVAKQIICTDLDSNAIDKLYLSIKRAKLQGIIPAQLNMLTPETTGFTSLPSERFRSEAVLALAVTHHLVLTNVSRLCDIFDIIENYSTKYVLIEFMPLGLWTETDSTPVPEWYNEQWFEQEFLKHFKLVKKEQLEKNRILFVGSKIK